MDVHEDLDDIKEAKERADHKGQLAKLQVGLLVSVILAVGIFLFKSLS
jgi:hypothetical protein